MRYEKNAVTASATTLMSEIKRIVLRERREKKPSIRFNAALSIFLIDHEDVISNPFGFVRTSA